MEDLLAKALNGVDPEAPGAFFTICMNLIRLVPWGQLILWQVVFIVVGALLGWWRGRFTATVVASLVLGPVGWAVPFLPRHPPSAAPKPASPPPRPASQPAPLPPPLTSTTAGRQTVVPPPLPGSKKG
ncbi:hypothetical protein [Luteibacter sp.]|uniref:hypothetical protein n=1 Tax=Luteibacter sp. TaxID=1886636 RepID=UPI003F8028F9